MAKTIVQPLDNAIVERVCGDIAKAIQGINADALPKDQANAGAFVQEMQRYSDAADRIGQSKGEAMLLGGMALAPIWESIPHKDDWLTQNKIGRSWAYEAMAFAQKPFTRDEARELGWRGMRNAIQIEKKKDEGGGGGGKSNKNKWVTHRDLEMKLLAAESALICVKKGLSKADAKEVLQDIPKAKALFKSARKILKDICDQLAPVECQMDDWKQRIRDRENQKDDDYDRKTTIKNSANNFVSLPGGQGKVCENNRKLLPAGP